MSSHIISQYRVAAFNEVFCMNKFNAFSESFMILSKSAVINEGWVIDIQHYGLGRPHMDIKDLKIQQRFTTYYCAQLILKYVLNILSHHETFLFYLVPM